jgi:hypothetical protein
MAGFIALYDSHSSGLQAITALLLFYTPSSSPLHTLGVSAFTSRILATDLSQSHWHFKSNGVYFSRPNSFLLNRLRLPSRELDQILDN